MSAFDAKLAQAQALANAGQWAQAQAVGQRLVQAAPSDPRVTFLMAQILERVNQLAKALFFAEKSAQLLPRDAVVRARLAYLLLASGKTDHAEKAARAAIDLDPRAPGPRCVLAAVLSRLGREVEAAQACRIDGQVPLDDPSLALNAAALTIAGAQPAEGLDLYRRAHARHPDDLALADGLCNALNFAPGVTREEVAAAHRSYGRLLESRSVAPRPALRDPDPERAIRLGIVSPDLHAHPVGRYMLPLLRHHDRARLEIAVFDTGVRDQSAARDELRAHAAGWINVGAILWPEFADLVRTERIDVLLELSGHTRWQCLELLPLRPAPIQATYLGYPGSTGLTCVDYRVVDSHTDPAPWADALATERLARLDPCFLCYVPPDDAPAPADPPCLRAGHVTFGSFNAAQKINAPLLALWARVLHAVPRSRLLLKAMAFAEAALRERVAALALAQGIAPDRLSILAPQGDPKDHLAQYAAIDIALDPHPYNGTTTTCEALSMGVPVVCLAGDRHASRVGCSLLHAAGLPEWVARDEDEYVLHAANLARSPDRLSALRRELRPRLLASSLGDAPAFARRFEAMVRGWWREAARGSLGSG